ncbi:MAG: amidohydrolase family protein [Candidatus Hodarchaeota archaeon]
MKDGYKIIDAHMHYAGIFMQKGTNLLDYMDENGIDGAVVNTLNTKANLNELIKQSIEKINEQEPGFELFEDFCQGQPSHKEVIQLAKVASDRIFPFFWYNPVDEDRENGLKLVEQSIKNGFKGVKIQPAMTPCTIGSLFPVAEILVEHGLPIYIHPSSGIFASSRTIPSSLIKLSKKFPDLNIILGHAAYTMEFCIEALVAATKMPNLYFETSVSIPYGIITYVKIFGPDRVIFGTDSPTATPFSIEYNKVAVLNIPREAKEMILYGNIAKLIGIEEI